MKMVNNAKAKKHEMETDDMSFFLLWLFFLSSFLPSFISAFLTFFLIFLHTCFQLSSFCSRKLSEELHFLVGKPSANISE